MILHRTEGKWKLVEMTRWGKVRIWKIWMISMVDRIDMVDRLKDLDEVAAFY